MDCSTIHTNEHEVVYVQHLQKDKFVKEAEPGHTNVIKTVNRIHQMLLEQWIKTALRAFKFNYIDVDEKKIGIDGKQLKVLKELRKKTTILKPHKGQGVVLLKQEDYTNCIEMLLTDRNKFKQLHKDLTMRLDTAQSYINKLFNCAEINKEQKILMRIKAA